MRWLGVVLSLLAVAATGAISIGGSDDHLVQAQPQVPPPFPTIVFNGEVTINGNTTTQSGLRITARIGNQWESPPVRVGSDPNHPSQYAYLIVAPPPELDLIGSQIEFWLNGSVKSTVTNWYACLDPRAIGVCTGTWTFPILRELDLDFPHLPDATATPTPTSISLEELEPPPLPAGFPQLVFRGAVTIDGETPTESGFQIIARIGSQWESQPVRVVRMYGRQFEYKNLAIRPPSNRDIRGAVIEFWLDGKVKADVTSLYSPYNSETGEFCTECSWDFPELRTLNLNFPHHPDLPPPPTPIPTPVATPTAVVQPSVPQQPIVIFRGQVTVDGQKPSRTGFTVTARIGDAWQSNSALIGSNPNNQSEYENLVVAPDAELNLVGSHIEFWIDNQVKSETKNVFAFLPGETCEACPPGQYRTVLRVVDLEFPRLPEPSPTPSPTAVPSPTSTPTPSLSPTAAPTFTPTSTPAPPSETIEPTSTPIPTNTPVPPTPTETPMPISTVSPTPTLVPSPAPSPTPLTSSPSPTPPSPSPIPPTSTPWPTPTPTIPTATLIPPTAPPATTDADARANALVSFATVAALATLVVAAYLRWRKGRRSRSHQSRNLA